MVLSPENAAQPVAHRFPVIPSPCQSRRWRNGARFFVVLGYRVSYRQTAAFHRLHPALNKGRQAMKLPQFSR